MFLGNDLIGNTLLGLHARCCVSLQYLQRQFLSLRKRSPCLKHLRRQKPLYSRARFLQGSESWSQVLPHLPVAWHRYSMGMWACPGRCLQLATLQSQLCEGQATNENGGWRRLPRSCSATSSEARRTEGLHSRENGRLPFCSGRFKSQRGLSADSNVEPQQPEYVQEKATLHFLEKEKKSQSRDGGSQQHRVS